MYCYTLPGAFTSLLHIQGNIHLISLRLPTRYAIMAVAVALLLAASAAEAESNCGELGPFKT